MLRFLCILLLLASERSISRTITFEDDVVPQEITQGVGGAWSIVDSEAYEGTHSFGTTVLADEKLGAGFFFRIPDDRAYTLSMWAKVEDSDCCGILELYADTGTSTFTYDTGEWNNITLGPLLPGSLVTLHLGQFTEDVQIVAFVDNIELQPIDPGNVASGVYLAQFLPGYERPASSYQAPFSTQNGMVFLSLKSGQRSSLLISNVWNGSTMQVEKVVELPRGSKMLPSLEPRASVAAQTPLGHFFVDGENLQTLRTYTPFIRPYGTGDYDGDGDQEFFFANSADEGFSVGLVNAESGFLEWETLLGGVSVEALVQGDFSPKTGLELALNMGDRVAIVGAEDGELYYEHAVTTTGESFDKVQVSGVLDTLLMQVGSQTLHHYDPVQGQVLRVIDTGWPITAFDVRGQMAYVFAPSVASASAIALTTGEEVPLPFDVSIPFDMVVAGEFDPRPGLEFLLLPQPGSSLVPALLNEHESDALWRGREVVRGVATVDSDHDGFEEVVSVERQLSGNYTMSLRDSISLETHQSIPLIGDPVDVVSGNLDTSDSRSEVGYVYRRFGIDYLDILGGASLDFIRTIPLHAEVERPVYFESNQLAAIANDRLVVLRLSDGRIDWMADALDDSPRTLIKGNVDADPSVEWVTVSGLGTVTVYDNESQQAQWSSSFPNVSAVASGDGTLFVGSEAEILKVDTKADDVRSWTNLPGPVSTLWVASHAGQELVFAQVENVAQVYFFTSEGELAGITSSPGAGFGSRSESLVLEGAQGFVMFGETDAGYVRAEFGSPAFPDPDVQFRDGFE